MNFKYNLKIRVICLDWLLNYGRLGLLNDIFKFKKLLALNLSKKFIYLIVTQKTEVFDSFDNDLILVVYW